MVLSVLKLQLSKAKAKEISYRNFRDFKEDNFNLDLQNRFSAEPIEEYATFEKVFLDVINRHAPLKKKVVRANHAPYITKTLKKAIMERSYLERVYFKKKAQDSLTKFKKQRITAADFIKKRGKNISKAWIQEESVTVKVFGKIYNLSSLKNERLAIRHPLLTIKKTLSLKTILFQMNFKFFENVTLEKNENSYNIDTDSNEINSVEKAINKYKNHTSVLLIKSRLKSIPSFSFNEVK